MIAPIAAVVAGAEPEIAAKIAAANTVTKPKPPVKCRTNTSATLIKRCDNPPADINSPANIKNGIASKEKDCVPATTVCGNSIGSMPFTNKDNATTMPIANAKGTPNSIKAPNPADNSQAVLLI